MSVLQSILQYKQMERQREMADINAIGTSVQNFLALRNQAQDRQLQMQDRELNNRFMEAKIKSMEPSELDLLLQRGQAAEAAKSLGNRDLFFDITGQKDPLKQENSFEAINNEIDDAAKVSNKATEVLDRTNNQSQLDQFLNEVDPMTGKPTPRAMRAESEFKSQEQAQRDVFTQEAKNKAKLKRFDGIIQSIENEWNETSPYKNKLIVGSGLTPVLGQWDIIKKGAGATRAQRKDQKYANFVKGLRAQLARGMGDVGNLSEFEQKAVMELVPTLYDSKQSGTEKLDALKRFIRTMTTENESNTTETNDPLGLR